MINTREMYNRYTGRLKKDLDSLCKKRVNIQKTFDKSAEKLEGLKEFINKRTTLSYETIDKVRLQDIGKITFGFIPLTGETKNNKDYLISTLRTYIAAKNELKGINSNIDKIKAELVNYTVYRFVVQEFNKKIVDKILEGYEYRLGHRVSTVMIKRKVRKPKSTKSGEKLFAINWGESNKLKAKLIAEGKTPKDKDNPNGEEWLVRHTSENECWWFWLKRECTITNKTLYSFVPTKGPDGNIKKLRRYLEAHPNAKLNYR